MMIPIIAALSAAIGLQPIDITATQMTHYIKESRMEFSGNVVAVQNDVTITCDTLSAYHGKDTKSVERVVAVGHVRIVQKDRVAAAERAEFNNRERTLRLTGGPRMWRGTDTIDGEEILVSFDKGTIRVKKAQAVYRSGKEAPVESVTP